MPADSGVEPVRAACSYCGVGCGLEVRTTSGPNGPVIASVVGDKLHPTNFGRLCTKGSTHAELAGSTDGRMTDALIRDADHLDFTPSPVDAAVSMVGARLRSILDAHGPDAIALYVSGQMSMEAQYVANKLAKGFIRTTHIESNSRLCMAAAGTGYKQSLGADGPPGAYDDFDCADLFFVIGSNMADCHPILYLRMADRLRAGAKLIVVDPRRTATAAQADLFLQIRPGTDIALLNGLLHLLVESGAVDHDFVARYTEGWDAMPEFLADYSPARVAEITGLAESDIRAAAFLIAEADNWMTCWTMGLNQSAHATWNTNAICNLHLATGAICRPGSGPMSLTGQPNAMGGREMGYMGPGLPGQRSVTSAEDRAFTEAVWGLEPGAIRPDVGPGTVAMFEQMAAGDIQACWIICTNPVATVPNRSTVIDGLSAAQFVVTQDIYRDTATNQYADVVLPATLWTESDAVMVNSERNLTLVSQCVAPVGQSRPDWQLICDVAAAMGFGEHFGYQSSAEIFDEIRRFWNPRTGWDIRGIDYPRLRRTSVQWPCPPDEQNDRNPTRYLNDGVSQHLYVDEHGNQPRLAFATPSRRAMFHPRPYVGARELPDEEHPFLLNTGRLPHQWHTMTKTGRVARLNSLTGGPFVEINDGDAATLGIVDGTAVELRSRRGAVVLPAVLTDRVLPGTCFAPMHWNDQHADLLTVNSVTNDAVDADSLQPALKMCAVALRGVDGHEFPALLTQSTVAANAITGVGDATTGVIVLWASQTGNAEELATRVVKELDANAVSARLVAMAACSPADLASATDLVVITSTYGDGGPPDDGADFWEQLNTGQAPDLSATRFAVLGIGDRSYSQFCGHARALDTRLAALGASRFLDATYCETADVDDLWAWSQQILTALGADIAPGSVAPDPPHTTLAERAAEPFTRAQPILARLTTNVRLTHPTSDKEVRQFGFQLTGPSTYDVGDALGVQPTNSTELVEAWLGASGTCGSDTVTVDGDDCSWREALTRRYDLCRITPDLLRFVTDQCPDKRARRRRRAAAAELDTWRLGRNGIDVLRRFPVTATPEQWQQVLIRLTPRFYSISSSPLVSPDEVRLLVSVVRYGDGGGIARGGVCSTYLADRAGELSTPIFLQKSPHFRPPEDPSTPIVMIGAGTGIAPFLGFLQHRRALGHSGRNWLVFGDRRADENFYYRDELTAMADDGHLTHLDLAFSRDQSSRIYVQHKLIEAGARLWSWLCDGAHIYVCGDATHMAKDVDTALSSIIAIHGRMSRDDTREYKRELIASKRYVRDVY